MKDLIIVGAGGFGRELLQWIKDINKIQAKWRIKGFIDDNPRALDNYNCEYKIIGSIYGWQPKAEEVFVCAIANPHLKEKIVSDLVLRGGIFETVIHPSVIIGESNILGKGLIVYPNAIITVNTVLGDYITLLSSSIGHDAYVGDYTTISSHCGINGSVKIGRRVFIGSHSTIIPGRKISDDVYIGAGSVVVNNVKPGRKVMGNPAKKLHL